jgi:RsiW-degrading membrane proteinase PrsW (M82 family)
MQELLKFLCVRRLLWFAFVTDSWALCCYGGAAGLGFAALEKLRQGRGRVYGSWIPRFLWYDLGPIGI